MNRRTLAVIATTLACLPLRAQETSGVERKGRVPVSSEVLRVRFPRAEKTTLPNGLTVLVLRDSKLPTVSMTLSLKAGSFFEPKEKTGLAELTASMLEEGTKSRTSEQIAELTDRLGASASADGGQGSQWASVSAGGMSEDTDTLMALVADMARNPVFPQGPFERLKRQTLAGLQQAMTQPSTLAAIATARAAYGDTPPGRVMPSPASVEALTVDDLKEYHARFYRPEGGYLAVTGAVKPSTVFAMARKYFGDWKRSTTPETIALPAFSAPSSMRITLVDRPGSVQASLTAVTLSLKRTDPDYVPLMVMNRILGGLPSSRLEANIREKRGFAYYARSSVSAPEYTGTLDATTEVRNEVASEALKELLLQFERMRNEPVAETELNAAKQGIVGAFARRLESPEALLAMALDVTRYGLPADYWDTYPARVQAVTADDIRRMARKYLAPERLGIIVVGEASALRKDLEAVAPVTVVTDPNDIS
jgi:zinc protease